MIAVPVRGAAFTYMWLNHLVICLLQMVSRLDAATISLEKEVLPVLDALTKNVSVAGVQNQGYIGMQST
jgi:hypothetical protein